MVSLQHLAFWLSSLKATFDHIAKTGEFPKPQQVSRNVDGTLRLTVNPSDYFTWTASGFSTLELHVECPESGTSSRRLSSEEASVMEAISGVLPDDGSGNSQSNSNETTTEKPTTTVELSSAELPAMEKIQHNPAEMFGTRGGRVAAVLGAGNCK